MTFNVFWLLKILTYLNDEIMNVPKKIINKRNEGDNMYRVGRAEQRRHLKTPGDHRNGARVPHARPPSPPARACTSVSHNIIWSSFHDVIYRRGVGSVTTLKTFQTWKTDGSSDVDTFIKNQILGSEFYYSNGFIRADGPLGMMLFLLLSIYFNFLWEPKLFV